MKRFINSAAAVLLTVAMLCSALSSCTVAESTETTDVTTIERETGDNTESTTNTVTTESIGHESSQSSESASDSGTETESDTQASGTTATESHTESNTETATDTDSSSTSDDSSADEINTTVGESTDTSVEESTNTVGELTTAIDESSVESGSFSEESSGTESPIPTDPVTLEYSVEDGQNVLTVTSDGQSSIFDGFLDIEGNKTVGDAVPPSQISVLRIGKDISYVRDGYVFEGMTTLDIVDGSGMYIETMAFYSNYNLSLILLGGGAVELQNDALRLDQDQRVTVRYKEGATPYKSKYTFGGYPVEFESNAAIPQISMQEYSLLSAGKARLLASAIASRFDGAQKNFLYMPMSSNISEYAKIKEFALELTKNATTEREKVNIVYDYIVQNIKYSDDALKYEPYRTLTEKKAVCAGYVALMHDMLCALEIASFYTSGYVLSTWGVTVENIIQNPLNISEGHAILSVVWQDGSVSFYDPTYAACGYSESDDMSDEYISTYMVITEVESLEVMLDGVDFTLYTGSSIQFIGDDGYIYNADYGRILSDLEYGGEVRNYWITQKIHIATHSNNKYADGTCQPAGTVMTNGLSYTSDNTPEFSLPSGMFFPMEKILAFIELEVGVYGKSIDINDSAMIHKDGVLYAQKPDGNLFAIKYYGLNEDLVIPATVNGIKVYGVDFSAFHYNNVIRSITLCEGVERMYLWALDRCLNLESISLPSTFNPDTPNGADYIWELRFFDLPSLKTIEVAEDNPYLTVYEGTLYNKDMTKLIHYPAALETDSFTLPDSVTVIGEGAFAHAKIKNIVWNDALERVEADAFAYAHLESVTLQAGVEYGSSAFGYSRIRSLVIEEGIDVIDAWLFFNCQSLQDISFPTTLTEIGPYAFHGCTSLIRLELPEGLITLGEYAFKGAKVVELTLPSTLQTIGNGAFSECVWPYHVINKSSLTVIAGSDSYGGVAANAFSVSEGDSESKLHFTDDGLIFYLSEEINILVGYRGTATDLVLPESINGEEYSIGYGAFAGTVAWGWEGGPIDRFCTWEFPSAHPTIHIKTITIPKTVTYIPKHAFTGLASLETVYFLGTREEFQSINVDYTGNGNREFDAAEVICSDDQ